MAVSSPVGPLPPLAMLDAHNLPAVNPDKWQRHKPASGARSGVDAWQGCVAAIGAGAAGGGNDEDRIVIPLDKLSMLHCAALIPG